MSPPPVVQKPSCWIEDQRLGPKAPWIKAVSASTYPTLALSPEIRKNLDSDLYSKFDNSFGKRHAHYIPYITFATDLNCYQQSSRTLHDTL